MEFIEEFVAGLIWIDEFSQFQAQSLYLFIVQEAYAGKITVGVEEFDLIVCETILLRLVSIEERRDRTMIAGKIFDHWKEWHWLLKRILATGKAALPPDVRKGYAFPCSLLFDQRGYASLL